MTHWFTDSLSCWLYISINMSLSCCPAVLLLLSLFCLSLCLSPSASVSLSLCLSLVRCPSQQMLQEVSRCCNHHQATDGSSARAGRATLEGEREREWERRVWLHSEETASHKRWGRRASEQRRCNISCLTCATAANSWPSFAYYPSGLFSPQAACHLTAEPHTHTHAHADVLAPPTKSDAVLMPLWLPCSFLSFLTANLFDFS